MSSELLVWPIALVTIAAIITRPKQYPEAVWASLGALLFLLFRLVSPAEAATAAARGLDVYLFLTGMMLLADLARHEGVFDWLAMLAVTSAKGSRSRLFLLIYGVGVAVTVFLSNDATAVVLTPAVYAAVKKAKVKALPYLFACAFIANAASFVLPISNPANLVVYGKTLPPLLPWLRTFALPSLLAILATFAALRWRCRGSLRGTFELEESSVQLAPSGRRAAIGILGTGVVLIVSSALGWDLGLPTLVAASFALLIATQANLRALREIVQEVSWSVLPLVAALFILVEGLNKAGASRDFAFVLQRLETLPAWTAALAASFGVTALSNILNNLPSGLMTGSAVQLAHVSPQVRNALLIGVDLGPNLSVTGSLATMLWLIALRREGEEVTAWEFLKMGAFVMTPALLLATLALFL